MTGLATRESARSVRSALGAVVALAIVSGIGSFLVAFHEWGYAVDHPYAYGPAKVIALAAAACAALAMAVALLGWALLRLGR